MSEITDLMVKYPFFEESKASLADTAIDEIVDEEPVLTRAKQRIITGIKSGTLMEGTVSNEIELKSYPLARILVSIIDEPFVLKKYAKAEAKTAVENLKNDATQETEKQEYLSSFEPETMNLEDIKEEFDIQFSKLDSVEQLIDDSQFSQMWSSLDDEQKPSVLEALGAPTSKEDENITADSLYQNLSAKVPAFKQDEKNDKYYTINLPDYLTNSVDKDGSRWNLSNRVIFNGTVLITQSELFELLEQLFYTEIYSSLPLSIDKKLREKLKPDTQDVKAALSDDLFFDDINTVEEGAFPPIIETILQRVRNGDQVSHEERITLATFLIHIGMTDDEIVEMLEVHPNFDDQTRYQLQHLRTKGEGGKAYTPPTYSTLQAWGVEWTADELEQKVKHPLTYYRIKLDEEGKLEESEDSTETE